MAAAPQRTRTSTFRVTGNRAVEQPTAQRGASRHPDGLSHVPEPEPGSFRARMHANPGTRTAYRLGIFVAGLLLILLGAALTVLPGPLTIPPVLAGLYVWSTEFAFARRFFAAFRRKAVAAWQHAKQHPVSSAAITVGGLAAAGVAIWAVGHFQLVGRAMAALGL